MNSMNSRLPIRFLLATALGVGLVVSNQSPFASSGSAARDLNLKSESQFRSEAALYDTAIREIERISTMKLANPDDSKAAIALLKKQTPNLKFIRSKVVELCLSDSSFRSAVKAKANDKKSAQEFAVELAKDRTAILKLNGAESLKNKIGRQVEADRSLLRKIGDQLKQGGAEIKAKGKAHHAVRAGFSLATTPASVKTNTSASPIPQLKEDAGEEVKNVMAGRAYDQNVRTINTLILAAAVLNPAVGMAILAVAYPETGVAIVEILVGAELQLIQDLEIIGGTEKQRDEILACDDRASAKCDKCMSAAGDLIYPFNLAAFDFCYGAELIDLALCAGL